MKSDPAFPTENIGRETFSSVVTLCLGDHEKAILISAHGPVMKQFLELIRAWSRSARQWLKALPLWMRYAGLIVVVGALGALLIWKWGFRKQIDTGLIGRSPEGQIENLWFSRDGSLVGTSSGVGLNVSLWRDSDPTHTPDEQVFPVHDFYDFLDSQLRAEFPTETKPRVGLPNNIAVMRDGKQMVINYRGLLATFPPVLASNRSDREAGEILTGSGQFEPVKDPNSLVLETADFTDLGPNKANSPTTLTVTDNGLLALAYDDGRVEFRNRENIIQVVGERRTNLPYPTLMKPLGDFLAVVSVPRAIVAVLDVNSVRDTPFHGYPPGADPLIAVSDKGRLAVSKGTNEVFLTKPDGTGDADIRLKAYGNVKTLSFFDDERVIVGGHFQDVFLLGENRLPYKIAVAPKGVKAMAVSSNRLAYAGEDGLYVYWHAQRRVLNKVGWTTIIVFAAFFLALHALYVYDERKRREEAEESIIPPVPLPTADQVARLGIPEVPGDLVKAFRDGECVLNCGSGVSAQAGFPYWQPFVRELTDWTINNEFVGPELGSSLRAALDQGQYDSVSDNLVSKLRGHQHELNQYLSGIFLKKAALPDSVKLLKDLPFSAVMTTNFDNLLEQAFEDRTTSTSSLTPGDAELLLQCLHKREFFLLKLYGKLEQPATVMLAPSQYDDVVTGNLVFSSFMETLLVSRTVFFVGSSLEGIQAYLKGMPLRRQSRRTHYALVPVTGEAWQAKANPLKERYGIEVLPYSPSEGHPELLKFLQNLDAQVRETNDGSNERREQTNVLKRISVNDIGPFDSLTLTFDPNWNILLGDNGVGKSSIIKAIAIAILGEDSKAYAQRIIKAGKPNSTITLESGRATYTTKLFRKNGEAKVDSIPGRAFEAEGWLAVAFPPLRTMSWARPTANTGTTGSQRPTTDDLLPVIRGEADPRLDDLKGWIVNVDYRIKDAKSRKQDPEPFERLLKDFFNVVSQLTTGTRIEFKGVDPSTKEISVITDDGELPIEALSQGMTSLIGWVGILLQRLYEVYGKDRDIDPKQHYALVLMDELDAHLHPAWQKSLIRKLSKIFPNVQFIATTHSPLIVGGMKPEQIIRFAREEEKVVTYTVTEEMTMGRADQILSSDLFGLQNTTQLTEDAEALMTEYHQLLARDDLDDAEETRLDELEQTLTQKLPQVDETPAEQKARGLLEALLTEDNGDHQRVNDKLLKHAEQLLTEVSKQRK